MADAPTPLFFAIVTTSKDNVLYGGMAPVFYAKDEEEQLRVAMWISRITDAAVHDLHNGSVVLIASRSSSG
jgi:hypothetical protein